MAGSSDQPLPNPNNTLRRNRRAATRSARAPNHHERGVLTRVVLSEIPTARSRGTRWRPTPAPTFRPVTVRVRVTGRRPAAPDAPSCLLSEALRLSVASRPWRVSLSIRLPSTRPIRRWNGSGSAFPVLYGAPCHRTRTRSIVSRSLPCRGAVPARAGRSLTGQSAPAALPVASVFAVSGSSGVAREAGTVVPRRGPSVGAALSSRDDAAPLPAW